MGFFKGTRREDERPDEAAAGDPLPIWPIDFSKRYDIYCCYQGDERLYENMRILAIRTMEKRSSYGSSIIGGYIEIEDPSGKRLMISNIRIEMLCEHGVQPQYKILRTWWRPSRPVQ